MKSNNSNFAADQLKKFGWKEGEGIGKTNQGIVNPIKASLKFGNSGLGFNLSEEFTKNWWDNLYNVTAKNIYNENKSTKGINHVEISKTPLNRKSFFYSRFEKGSTLIDGKTVEKSNIIEEKTEQESKKKGQQSSEASKISDEEIFRFCAGRTGHKGARHGIKMNGKLSRLENQDKFFSETIKKLNDQQKQEKTELCLKQLSDSNINSSIKKTDNIFEGHTSKRLKRLTNDEVEETSNKQKN